MEEKIMILKMLEEGKITSEEALKLLESLEKTNRTDSAANRTDKAEENDFTDKFEDKINKFSKKAEKFADKFGPDFIAKVESVSTDFANAAVKFADKIVNYINSGFNNSDVYKSITKNYNFPIGADEKVKLIIRTQNVSINTNYTDASEVSMEMKLKFFFEEPDIDTFISTKYENGVVYLHTDFPIRTWGSMTINLPKNVEAIEAETSNSKCIFDGFKGKALYCTTSNGKIELMNCYAAELAARTNNSKIYVYDSKSDKAEIHTSNSNIEIENSAFGKLTSDTSNGTITLNRFDCPDIGEASYKLRTSNGKINIYLPKNSSSGYKIKARTSLGNINISNLDSSYVIDRGEGNMRAEASITSTNYESFSKRIYIEASTSNSSINIIND